MKNAKTLIVLPNILNNPVYVDGLKQPLELVAEILDEQNKSLYALALRESCQIIDAFVKINLLKEAELYSECKSN